MRSTAASYASVVGGLQVVRDFAESDLDKTSFGQIHVAGYAYAHGHKMIR